MRERYREEARFGNPNITIEAGANMVPVARKNEIFPITYVPFVDHGRPAYIASTIQSNRVFIEAENELTQEEIQRFISGEARIMEGLLDGHPIKGATVLSSTEKGKPNIYVVTFGDPFNSTGLRLYFHPGEYQGAKTLIRDARTRIKRADKIERVFRQLGGYSAPKSWEIKRKSS